MSKQSQKLGYISGPRHGVFKTLRVVAPRLGQVTHNMVVHSNLKIPVVPNVALLDALTESHIVYDRETANVYVSDGQSWLHIGPDEVPLSNTLNSIDSLNTSGGEILYTTSSGNYATSAISPAGRSLISAVSAFDQRSAMGIVLGIDVQMQSFHLNTVDTIAKGPANQIMYTSGTGVVSAPLSDFTRNNVLNATSSSALNTLLNSVTSTLPLATANALVKNSGTTDNDVTESGVLVDVGNNMSGVQDLTIQGDLSVGGTLGGLSSAILAQLANVNGNTIGTTQWNNLSALDQGVATTDTPTFNGLNVNNGVISNLAPPVNPLDAVSKSYADAISNSGAPPLDAVKCATTMPLPASTYASPAETLTATANAALIVDGIPVAVNNRVLVHDQTDARENGIYTVTAIGSAGSPWVLTRALDFNQAAMPVPAGSSVFVQLNGDATNNGSTWAVAGTITTVDPLTDTVTFVQLGAGFTLSAGSGIDSAALISGTVSTSITPRLMYMGNALDINTVAVPYGGTGNTALTSNGVLVGQGTAALNTSKMAPGGDFVGSTDTQVLTNKTLISPTNTVVAEGLFTNSGNNMVSTLAAVAPTSGEVLMATSGTTATWQPLSTNPQPDRTLVVYPSANNVAPNFSTLGAALVEALSLTPTALDQVLIRVFPGLYSENTPLTVPSHVNVVGESRDGCIIRPISLTPSGALVQLLGDAHIQQVTFDGDNGNAAYADIGVMSSIGSVVGAVDMCREVTVRNCNVAGFKVSGDGSGPSTKQLVCKSTRVEVTAASPFTMATGYEIDMGGHLSGNDINAFGGKDGFGILMNGVYVHSNFSFVDVFSLSIRICDVGVRVGGGVTAVNQQNYPTFRVFNGNIGYISGVALWMQEKSVGRLSDFRVHDNTSTYPNQIHLRIDSPALPAAPNFVSALWSNFLYNRIVIGGPGAATNPPVFRGLNLSEIPGEIQNIFQGELIVGLPASGSEMAVGEGDSFIDGMRVLIDDGGVFSDMTNMVSAPSVSPIAVNVVSTVAIDLASAPLTVDGETLSPGVSRVLVQQGSTANAGTISVDNGIYVWQGAGVAMTRASDFAAGDLFSKNTWFGVELGTLHYGSKWHIDATTFNTVNVLVGTTAFAIDPTSFKVFPAAPADNDALYIGATQPMVPFYGVKMAVISKIQLSGGSALGNAIVWEYYNGATWIEMPTMATDASAPYRNLSSATLGFDDTTSSPDMTKYHNRFQKANDWASTLVDGTLGYWVRVRVLNASLITRVPVLDEVKLHSNHTEINKDGFMEFFGTSRATNHVSIPSKSFYNTGINNVTDPATATLTFSNTDNRKISYEMVNSTFNNNTTTSAAIMWTPPSHMDTSQSVTLVLNMTRSTGGANNVLMQIDYAFVHDGDTTNALGRTVQMAVPVASSAKAKFQAKIPLDLHHLKPGLEFVALKITRLGSDVLDNYNNSVYVLGADIYYSIWCHGKYM